MIATEVNNGYYSVECEHCGNMLTILKDKTARCRMCHKVTLVTSYEKKTHKKQVCEMSLKEIYEGGLSEEAFTRKAKRKKFAVGTKVTYYVNNEPVESFTSLSIAADYFEITYTKLLYQFKIGKTIEKYGIDLRSDKIVQYDKIDPKNYTKVTLTQNGEKIEFHSIRQCAIYLNVSKTSMRDYLAGKRVAPYPYDVRYKGEKK